MSAAKHTPGPWAVDEDGVVYRAGFRHGYIKLATAWREDAWCGADGDDESRANARRIVACVNACEGVPIEVLEAQQAGGLPWNVADQIDKRVERDELLAVLREAYNAFAHDDDGPVWSDSLIAKTLAVIAKATGEQA